MPSSLEEWEANKSTKLDALVKMLLHHLEEDNRAPLVLDEHNNLVPDPTFVPTPRGPNSPPDRIVVYVAFPSNNPLIKAV